MLRNIGFVDPNIIQRFPLHVPLKKKKTLTLLAALNIIYDTWKMELRYKHGKRFQYSMSNAIQATGYILLFYKK